MWWNDYIGIPFKWHGSDRDGCSCWGLVRLVARDVFGKTLPSHDDIESRAAEGRGAPQPYFSAGQPVDLTGVREGDILHMWATYKGKRLPLHVGIITEPGKVLHIEEGTGSIVEDYTRTRCAWRVIGAYRLA